MPILYATIDTYFDALQSHIFTNYEYKKNATEA